MRYINPIYFIQSRSRLLMYNTKSHTNHFIINSVDSVSTRNVLESVDYHSFGFDALSKKD